jgi:hypothetical protein
MDEFERDRVVRGADRFSNSNPPDKAEDADGVCIRCGCPINNAECDVCAECQDGGDPREDR